MSTLIAFVEGLRFPHGTRLQIPRGAPPRQWRSLARYLAIVLAHRIVDQQNELIFDASNPSDLERIEALDEEGLSTTWAACESPNKAGRREDDKPEVATQSIKRPDDKAFQAWRLRDLEGWTQGRIAAALETNQGRVSRWIKAVKEYLEAGNVLPDLGAMSKPETVDPGVIDMGARSDGRTPRQRLKRKDDPAD